jgi:hypothetical protein
MHRKREVLVHDPLRCVGLFSDRAPAEMSPTLLPVADTLRHMLGAVCRVSSTPCRSFEPKFVRSVQWCQPPSTDNIDSKPLRDCLVSRSGHRPYRHRSRAHLSMRVRVEQARRHPATSLRENPSRQNMVRLATYSETSFSIFRVPPSCTVSPKH